MFQLLRDPKIDFMARRQLWLTVSVIAVLLSIGLILFKGINFGVEFTGGTEVWLKFAERQDVEDVREPLTSDGIVAQVTTIGNLSDNEVLIKVATIQDDAVKDEQMTRRIVALLRGGDVSDVPDLNVVDATTIDGVLERMPDLAADRVTQISNGITAARRDSAIFTAYEQLSALPGVDGPVLEHLRAETTLGPIALRSQSYVGPSIGDESKNRALKAVVGSLIGMLIYIWIRFQLGWGLAAVLTLAHDTLVTIGLFVVFGRELSLPVVAAFLTLVGYSANDTVVVFDRIRENIRRKPKMKMVDVINLSINQTLSRTVITSGLTFIAVLALFIFGGPALNAFSFVLVVGVIVGTYSSIYVASPILLLTRRYLERGDKAQVAEKATA